MEVYHESVSGTVTPRTLGPYEFIATPPTQLVLNAILDQCAIGDCINPGVRGLAEQTGVSRGLITDCLRTLADDGWIDYDGRNITLLRHPASEEPSDRSGDRSLEEAVENEPEAVIDQVIDHYIAADLSDRSGDRSVAPSPILAAVQRRAMRQTEDSPGAKKSDRSPDRSAHMVHDYITTTSPVVVHESRTTGGSGGMADRSGDRPHPAAQVMAELGAEPRVIADAFAARPDWTPQQVRDRWDYDARRIAASDGKLTEGVFFHALRCGQLAPARPSYGYQLDPESYADRPGFKLGGDVAPPDESEQREAAYRNAHWRAVELLGPGAPFRDMAIVVEALVSGASDEQALGQLEERRRQSRPGGRDGGAP